MDAISPQSRFKTLKGIPRRGSRSSAGPTKVNVGDELPSPVEVKKSESKTSSRATASRPYTAGAERPGTTPSPLPKRRASRPDTSRPASLGSVSSPPAKISALDPDSLSQPAESQGPSPVVPPLPPTGPIRKKVRRAPLSSQYKPPTLKFSSGAGIPRLSKTTSSDPNRDGFAAGFAAGSAARGTLHLRGEVPATPTSALANGLTDHLMAALRCSRDLSDLGAASMAARDTHLLVRLCRFAGLAVSKDMSSTTSPLEGIDDAVLSKPFQHTNQVPSEDLKRLAVQVPFLYRNFVSDRDAVAQLRSLSTEGVGAMDSNMLCARLSATADALLDAFATREPAAGDRGVDTADLLQEISRLRERQAAQLTGVKAALDAQHTQIEEISAGIMKAEAHEPLLAQQRALMDHIGDLTSQHQRIESALEELARRRASVPPNQSSSRSQLQTASYAAVDESPVYTAAMSSAASPVVTRSSRNAPPLAALPARDSAARRSGSLSRSDSKPPSCPPNGQRPSSASGRRPSSASGQRRPSLSNSQSSRQNSAPRRAVVDSTPLEPLPMDCVKSTPIPSVDPKQPEADLVAQAVSAGKRCLTMWEQECQVILEHPRLESILDSLAMKNPKLPIKAIKSVHQVIKKLMARVKANHVKITAGSVLALGADATPSDEMTTRHSQILELIGEMHTNGEEFERLLDKIKLRCLETPEKMAGWKPILDQMFASHDRLENTLNEVQHNQLQLSFHVTKKVDQNVDGVLRYSREALGLIESLRDQKMLKDQRAHYDYVKKGILTKIRQLPDAVGIHKSIKGAVMIPNLEKVLGELDTKKEFQAKQGCKKSDQDQSELQNTVFTVGPPGNEKVFFHHIGGVKTFHRKETMPILEAVRQICSANTRFARILKDAQRNLDKDGDGESDDPFPIPLSILRRAQQTAESVVAIADQIGSQQLLIDEGRKMSPADCFERLKAVSTAVDLKVGHLLARVGDYGVKHSDATAVVKDLGHENSVLSTEIAKFMKNHGISTKDPLYERFIKNSDEMNKLLEMVQKNDALIRSKR